MGITEKYKGKQIISGKLLVDQKRSFIADLKKYIEILEITMG